MSPAWSSVFDEISIDWHRHRPPPTPKEPPPRKGATFDANDQTTMDEDTTSAREQEAKARRVRLTRMGLGVLLLLVMSVIADRTFHRGSAVSITDATAPLNAVSASFIPRRAPIFSGAALSRPTVQDQEGALSMDGIRPLVALSLLGGTLG